MQEQRVEVVGAPRAQARGGVNLDFRLPVGVWTDHRGRIREPGGINPVGAAMAALRTVGWVERSETHRPACNHAARNDGFRFALPILHTLSSPGGRAALRQAWPPTDGLCFSSTSSSCATASGERVYGASRA